MTEKILVGKVAGAHGVRGWIKVFPFTETRQGILKFRDWVISKHDQNSPLKLITGKVHGKFVVAQLEGIESREYVEGLKGSQVLVERSQFSEPGKDEYYWTDLIGLKVFADSGDELGTVENLMETGANDVLVVKGERERLIPFLLERVVKKVDLDAGTLVVDWDPDF